MYLLIAEKVDVISKLIDKKVKYLMRKVIDEKMKIIDYDHIMNRQTTVVLRSLSQLKRKSFTQL